ncbi:MAG: hypothetical protein KDC06_12160, partial [Chitinophagaceae bacterium]|nr:hypothetical protein [Chitinophagaceae bacterium]
FCCWSLTCITKPARKTQQRRVVFAELQQWQITHQYSEIQYTVVAINTGVGSTGFGIYISGLNFGFGKLFV